MVCVAILVAVNEVRPDFSQIARSDWPIALHTEGLWTGRSAIHQDESHVAPPNAKQNTVSAGWGPLNSELWKMAAGVSPRRLSGGEKST